mmetsp:Transcript_46135/g.53925  ORF Transcript_46135/g.53925 Transcript_46135/m.53925 type:complete len:724 (-) Transcript_46135:189-2360(-)
MISPTNAKRRMGTYNSSGNFKMYSIHPMMRAFIVVIALPIIYRNNVLLQNKSSSMFTVVFSFPLHPNTASSTMRCDKINKSNNLQVNCAFPASRMKNSITFRRRHGRGSSSCCAKKTQENTIFSEDVLEDETQYPPNHKSLNRQDVCNSNRYNNRSKKLFSFGNGMTRRAVIRNSIRSGIGISSTVGAVANALDLESEDISINDNEFMDRSGESSELTMPDFIAERRKIVLTTRAENAQTKTPKLQAGTTTVQPTSPPAANVYNEVGTTTSTPQTVPGDNISNSETGSNVSNSFNEKNKYNDGLCYTNNNISGIDPYEANRMRIFERVAPSVVFIDTFAEARDVFSTNVMEVPLGAGSGFVWDEQGHIVTNYHVIRQAKSAQVAILTRLNDIEDNKIGKAQRKQQNTYVRKPGMPPSSKIKNNNNVATRSNVFPSNTVGISNPDIVNYTRSVYKARIIGVDPDKDIAVLKIDAPVIDLFPIDVGTSQGLRIGQSSLAIGNPFGLDHSLTSGIISGIGREVRSPSGRPISNVIQTDAAINPGNSGGPLLNAAGQLIGINTAIYSPTGASAGIGFAIPVDAVSYIVDTLIKDGRIVRPVLGISYLESKQAKALGVNRGVLVLDVPSNSPAYRAGMRGTRRTETGLIEIGDIIIQIDEARIDTEADLFEALQFNKPGDKVSITVNRAVVDKDMNRVDPQRTGRQLKMSEKILVTQLKSSAEGFRIN